MGLELVNGYAGTPHVTSYQDAMINAGITGYDNVVFDFIGQALKAVVTSANNVRIYDGCGTIGGKAFCINKGEYVDVPIANGTSGKYRTDLICVKYTKDTSTGIEGIKFEVVQGTAGTSYVDPAVTKNDLYSTGTVVSQEKLYRVKINGLAIESVELLFETMVTNKELNNNLCFTFVENVYWGKLEKGKAGWTASDYGIMNVLCKNSTNTNNHYYYIKDITANLYVGTYFNNFNGTRTSFSFPVIKGHLYRCDEAESVEEINCLFYKIGK